MATAIGEICVSASPRASHQGKGAALRDGFARATNDIVIVQDADLEYNPSDYPKLIQPILDDHADVVFGSRFIGGAARRVLYFWHAVGNRVLTALSNLCTNIDLTDMGTGYKVFRLRGRNPTLSGLPVHRRKQKWPNRLHHVCQEKLFNPGLDVSMNLNSNSILTH